MKRIEDMTRDELRAEAKEYKIVGRGKMTKEELSEAILEARYAPPEEKEVVLPSPDFELTPKHVRMGTNRMDPSHRGTQLLAAKGLQFPMPLNYRGRAQGAKHFPYMRQESRIKSATTFNKRLALGYAVHLPNSERVQKYAKQVTRGRFALVKDCKYNKLTHRQMRRVRKNANKHAEGFVYGRSDILFPGVTGYRLLARMPEGLGIFHKTGV